MVLPWFVTFGDFAKNLSRRGKNFLLPQSLVYYPQSCHCRHRYNSDPELNFLSNHLMILNQDFSVTIILYNIIMYQETECALFKSVRRDTVRMDTLCIDPSVRFVRSHTCKHYIGEEP